MKGASDTEQCDEGSFDLRACSPGECIPGAGAGVGERWAWEKGEEKPGTRRRRTEGLLRTS